MRPFNTVFCQFISLFWLAVLFLAGCTPANNTSELEKLAWLKGTWANEINGQKTVESWAQKPDKTYLVKGWLLEGNDTIFSETIEVKKQGRKVIYQVNIPGQNQDKPVTFTLTENSETKVIFSNPEHDFPNQISYLKISENSLQVELQGTVNGKPVEQKYPLSKVNETSL